MGKDGCHGHQYRYDVSTSTIDSWPADNGSVIDSWPPKNISRVKYEFYVGDLKNKVHFQATYATNPHNPQSAVSWSLYDDKGNNLQFGGVEAVDESGLSLSPVVKYFVVGHVGCRWQRVRTVKIDFTEPVRKVQLFE